jgi:hypothetical protein
LSDQNVYITFQETKFSSDRQSNKEQNSPKSKKKIAVEEFQNIIDNAANKGEDEILEEYELLVSKPLRDA